MDQDSKSRELAEILIISREVSDRIARIPDDNLLDDIKAITKNRLSLENRSWIWEIHKGCDHLLHQRLAAFTAAQAMTLGAFTILTVARFNAGDNLAHRIHLLEASRFMIVFFGMFLSASGWLVTYPMLKRIQYLNNTYLRRDEIYRNYLDEIENQSDEPNIQ